MPERPEWLEQLPEELQGNEYLNQFESIEKVAQAVVDLNGKHSDFRERLGKAVTIPNADASEAEWEAFEKRIGQAGYAKDDPIPEKPEEYDLNEAVNGTKLEGEQKKRFTESRQKFYHEAGIGKRTATKLAKADIAQMDAAATQLESDEQLALKALGDHYGSDKIQPMMEAAYRAASAFGIEKLLSEPIMQLDGSVTSLGNNTGLLMSLIKMGANMTEDKTGQQGGTGLPLGGGEPASGEVMDDLIGDRNSILSKYTKVMRADPSDPELRVLRRDLRNINGRISAARQGVPFKQASVQDIADSVAKRKESY